MPAFIPATIVVDIDPILAQIGPLAFRWYGLMYVVGIAVGLMIAYPYGRQLGLTDDDVWAFVWPSVIAGFIGARLYFVAQQPLEPYLQQPWRVFATWEGGMAFYGAIFAVIITLIVIARRRKVSLWRVADAGVIFAVVGQTFGRVGNIVNGDIVGAPTTLPWGFQYVHPGSFVADRSVAYQPAAVYELFFNVALFGLLWMMRHRLPRPGLLFSIYLGVYSLGQFLLFFLRAESLTALGLKQAQLTSLAVLLATGVLAWWLMNHPETKAVAANPEPTLAGRPARVHPRKRRRSL